MDTIIKPISEFHIESFRRAFDKVVKEGKYFGSLDAPTLESFSAKVRKNIEDRNPHFVATHAGEVVGWCEVVRLNKPLFHHVGIFEVGLLPEWRGQGIGRPLITATLDAAFERGFTRIELTVFASNTRAIALYEKIGFNKEGELIDAVYIDGVFSNSILMGLINR
ncbi:MAG: GNAT family N-acetyltransferase [Rhodobacteraceae bacterium]|nr:GNAT family N-acetyltransferase [Paracoccaceae bacterium]